MQTSYQGDNMQTPTTAHRAGRMLEGLLASKNKNARLVLTVDLIGTEKRYHQTFQVKTWTGRDGTPMLSVDVKGAWPRQKVLYRNLITGATSIARESKDDTLLAYAGRAALGFAYTGETPTAPNGTVEIHEESVCGCCGRELTDPVSIERGIGPDCYGKQTGTTTITAKAKAERARRANDKIAAELESNTALKGVTA
jgi:hypothetical protein